VLLVPGGAAVCVSRHFGCHALLCVAVHAYACLPKPPTLCLPHACCPIDALSEEELAQEIAKANTVLDEAREQVSLPCYPEVWHS